MEKRAEDEIRREVDRRLQEIEMQRREAQAQGLSFAALSEEELTNKLTRESANSPYIYASSWVSGTQPGTQGFYSVFFANTGEREYFPVFVTIFFGMANFMADISLGPAARHTEWPYLSSAAFGLPQSVAKSASFTYQTPTNVALGTYTGNAVLWGGERHDRGYYMDRAVFEVRLWGGP